jgi:Putative peptidoglycan binding domain
VPSFPLSSAGSVPGAGWRPLRYKPDALQKGWDVYDLQCKLNASGTNSNGFLVKDGVFGPATSKGVREFQAKSVKALVIDGIAGAATQVELAGYVIGRGQLPNRVLGQAQKESSLLCGIYTATYSNGSQDTGPLQMNTQYHPNLNQNFDIAYASQVLVARIYEYHNKYVRWGVTEDRAWAAAQGAWNSPVLADRYARGESVPNTFVEYVDAVTIFA